MMKSMLCSTIRNVTLCRFSVRMIAAICRIMVGFTPATGSSKIDQARPRHHRRGDRQQLALPIGQHLCGGVAIGGQADLSQQFLRAGLRDGIGLTTRGAATERVPPADAVMFLRCHAKVLLQRQLAIGTDGLERARQSGQRHGMGGHAGEVTPRQRPAALVGSEEAADAVDAGTLARTRSVRSAR